MNPARPLSNPGSRRRWLVHLTGLAAVLVLLVVLGEPGAPYFVDEGGLWLQLDARLEGAWGIPYAYGDVDPEWRFMPLARAARTDAGITPYLRHPLHIMVATPLFALGSHVGLLALSIAAVVATAGLAAATAQRIAPRTTWPVFWIVGIASPLTFHAQLWTAHPVAAAGSALAVLGAVRVLHGQPRWLAAIALGTVTAAAFRTEGLLFGPALAAGFGTLWLMRRVSFSTALRVGSLAAIMPLLVWLGERIVSDALVGSISPTARLSARSPTLLGSIEAAFITLMSSSYAAYALGWGLVASPLLIYVLAKRSRFSNSGLPLAIGLLATSGMFGARLILGDVFPVPGILVAFPFGVAALGLLDRDDLLRDDVVLSLSAATTLAVGVLATQYQDGGGFEWGWRYYSLGIPLLVPILASAVARLRRGADRRWLVASAALLAGAMLAVQLFTVRWFHDLHVSFVEDVSDFAGERSLGERPLIVAIGNGLSLVPGLFTTEFERYSWLSAEGGTVVEVARFLEQTETTEFVALRPSGRTAEPGPPWHVVSVALRPPFDLVLYRR